jgi:hypothetical protein
MLLVEINASVEFRDDNGAFLIRLVKLMRSNS